MAYKNLTYTQTHKMFAALLYSYSLHHNRSECAVWSEKANGQTYHSFRILWYSKHNLWFKL